MVRSKDSLWKHVDKEENGRVRCKFCGKKFAGGITRFKSHLSGREGNDIKVCKKVPPDIQLAVLQVLDTPNKKERQVDVSKKKRKDKQVENEYYSVPSSSSGQNLCMDNVLMGKNLGKLFYSFGIHPEVILSPIFEDFVKAIVGYGPRTYQLASTFTGGTDFEKVVTAEDEECTEIFKNDLDQEGYSLMVNIWKKDNFSTNDILEVFRVDIFAYSRKGAACFASNNYSGMVEIGGIQEFLASNFDCGLPLPNQYVVQILISNGVSGIIDWEIFEDISEEILKIKNYHARTSVSYCAARQIDDLFYDVKEHLRYFIALLGFVFNACHHYNVSSKRVKERPKEKYAFILVMLKFVLEIEDELQDDLFSSKIAINEKDKAKHFVCAKCIDYIIGSKEFWSRVKAVEQVWILLLQTRCVVYCEDSSMGHLYQMVERLQDGIEKSKKYDHYVYDGIWDGLEDMRPLIIRPLHAAAAFLDPAYMCTKNFEENEEIINGINYMLKNMVDSKEKEAFKKELDQYREELPTLFSAPAMVTMLKTCHPRTWWDFRVEYTVLRKYAVRILSQPCSTSFCKQYEMPLGDLRRDWTTKVNTIIMSRNSKLPGLKPIILDKLVEDLLVFKDVMELDHECFINVVLSGLPSDAEVDCRINYPSPSFWEDAGETFLPLKIFPCL